MRIEPHFDRIANQWAAAQELMPVLKKADVNPMAGVFVMTPDQFPLIGRVLGLPNYWVAAGALYALLSPITQSFPNSSDGVSSAGGLGAFVAEWMVKDEPPAEMFDFDVNRFSSWADRCIVCVKLQ